MVRTWRLTGVMTMIVLAIVIVLTATGTASAAGLTAHGSARQVYMTGLAPHARASLLTATGRTIRSKRADSLGGLLFTDIAPGRGYRVRLDASGRESAPVVVHSDAATPWDPQVYRQHIKPNGYQYLTTRDGTKLAIDVHPPDKPAGLTSLPDGLSLPSSYSRKPYPTLIEYSGYGYADPAGPDSGIAVLANLMGFAVVDVNMRGTGCSGGAFNYFEPLQNLDGYDVIETIAHQPWVLDHKVGMMGISYGAISQLFTAQLDPPALEAISPLSTIDSTLTTLYPGGILNTGFAVPWAADRQNAAKPAGPHAGQAWAYKRIRQGDETCKRNQALHSEAPNIAKLIRENSHPTPSVANPLDPITFVRRITAAVFMACQWEDEQPGGHCADLASHFTDARRKWFTFTNGAHIDSLDPATFDRWYDFLSLFVAHRAPKANAAIVGIAAPLFYSEGLGVSDVTLPADPIQQITTYRAALKAYERIPEIRVLFDNGAGANPSGQVVPGDPYAAFSRSFSRFPIPGTVLTRWYFGAGGALTPTTPKTAGTDRFTWNPKAVSATDYRSSNTSAGGLWGDAADWDWDWQQNPPGTAVSYLTAPLTTSTTVIGGGSVRVWIKASQPTVDLQATISEVSPDGIETFVQNGWLRARKVPSVTGTRFEQVEIPLYDEGHAYTIGSRIRVTLSAPGGTQPLWAFAQTTPKAAARVSVDLSPAGPSSLTLPVVPGVKVATGVPPCPSLRNEPCRSYVPLVNETGGPEAIKRRRR